MVLMPFIIIAMIAAFWLVYIWIKKKDRMYFIERLLTSMVIVVFSIQPSIADSLLSMISCFEVGDDSYITNYLTEKCYTETHTKWLLALFLPGFLLYVLIMPMLAMMYMFYNKEYLYESKHIKKVGFLSIGYSYNKFYWEFIFFYRKILLIFIIKFISWSGASKALLMILFLWVSLWYQANDNPYLTNDLNSVDFKATFVSFVTIFSGLLSYETRRMGMEIIVIIVVFFFNLLFLYYWIRRMLIIKLPLYMDLKYLKCFSSFFKKMLPEYNNLRAQALKVDLMQCMNSSIRKAETPSSGAIMMGKENPRKTVFSHFKDALSKLIANAADDNNQRNSRFLNTTDDATIRKNKSSVNLLAFTPQSKSSNLLSPKIEMQALRLHQCSFDQPEKQPSEHVESDHEISTTRKELLFLKKPGRLDDDSAEGFKQEAVSITTLDIESKMRKNLLDRELIESCDENGLRRMLYAKIDELHDLYEEMNDLKKEIDEIRTKNQAMERNLSSIKKHPNSHKLSSIKRLETRKNNVYFQEDKPKNETFTAPPSDVTKKPHFLKHEIEKQQIYREWIKHNSNLKFLVSFLSFNMTRETISNKLNTNIVKIKCQIKNEITQKIDGLSIKITTTKSF